MATKSWILCSATMLSPADGKHTNTHTGTHIRHAVHANSHMHPCIRSHTGTVVPQCVWHHEGAPYTLSFSLPHAARTATMFTLYMCNCGIALLWCVLVIMMPHRSRAGSMPMPMPLWCHAACTSSGKIYVVGGCYRDGIHSSAASRTTNSV